MNSILESSTLPIGGAAAKCIKDAEPSDPSVDGHRTDDEISSTVVSSQIADTLTSYGTAAYPNRHAGWPIIAFPQQTNPHAAALYNHRRASAVGWCKQEYNSIQNHDLQLHFQSSTQNFLQPAMVTSNANTVFHNLMNLESSAQRDGTTTNSNSGLFSNISLSGNCLQMANSSIPSGIAVSDSARAPFSAENDGSSTKINGYNDNMLSNSDPFARGLYYLSQHSPGLVKANYGNATYNNWMTPAVQTLAPRPNLTVCHAPVFTVWNDT